MFRAFLFFRDDVIRSSVRLNSIGQRQFARPQDAIRVCRHCFRFDWIPRAEMTRVERAIQDCRDHSVKKSHPMYLFRLVSLYLGEFPFPGGVYLGTVLRAFCQPQLNVVSLLLGRVELMRLGRQVKRPCLGWPRTAMRRPQTWRRAPNCLSMLHRRRSRSPARSRARWGSSPK